MIFISYSVYPLSLCDKKGEYFLVLFGVQTENVFPNQSSVFVPEWPEGEFVSIFISYILVKTKTLFLMVAF
jgi:hypothetical protein